MRVLRLIALIALASNCVSGLDFYSADVAQLDSDGKEQSRMLAAESTLAKRSLRQNNDDQEDRGGGGAVAEKVEQVVRKVDDVMGKAKKTSKLDALIRKNFVEFEDFALRPGLSQKLADAYKPKTLEKMSIPAMQQLEKVEVLRKWDIKHGNKGSKKTPDGMRRKEFIPIENMKRPPDYYMVSHIGRGEQLFGPNGERKLSAAVVSRPAEQGGGQVLLISSSNPAKGDWLLPKGGWDKGESIEAAALREVVEEGGVSGQLAHALTPFKGEGKDTNIYHPFLMNGDTVFEDWPESIRYRIWVSYDEAIELLKDKRPEMVRMIQEAKEIDMKIKAGELAKLDAKISKVKLPHLDPSLPTVKVA